MEEKDYPGYTNIAFQRDTQNLFSFFRWDLETILRFSVMTRRYLQEEAERQEVARAARESVIELRGSFTDILLSSAIVTVYGGFEGFLFDVCRAVHEHGIDQRDPKGCMRTINTAAEYLSKVPKLRFPSDTEAWVDLNNLKHLRNTIAHNRRKLHKEDQEERRQALALIPHVTVNDRMEVWLDWEVLEHEARVLATLTDLLEKALGVTSWFPRKPQPTIDEHTTADLEAQRQLVTKGKERVKRILYHLKGKVVDGGPFGYAGLIQIPEFTEILDGAFGATMEAISSLEDWVVEVKPRIPFLNLVPLREQLDALVTIHQERTERRPKAWLVVLGRLPASVKASLSEGGVLVSTGDDLSQLDYLKDLPLDAGK